MKKLTDIKVFDVRKQPGDSAFLLDDGEVSILYDTGFGFTGFEVAENIKKALGERELNYIFLTHSHYDHALGSAYILRHYPDAKVVAGKYASEIFKRDGAKRIMKDLDRKFADKCGYGEYEFLGDELRVDIPCDDGDVIDTGNLKFEVINLPGHTKCSVGFYCKENGLFLSTETLGVYDGEETILPSCLVGYNMALKSMERVEGLEIKKLLAPHYGFLSEKQTEFFLKNMKKATEGIIGDMKNMIASGESDEAVFEYFKATYWHGYIKEIYPVDAMKLNISIMLKLIKTELLGQAQP